MSVSRRTVSIKVTGTNKDVLEFVKQIEERYLLVVKSRLMQNERDSDFHLFLDLNPYMVNPQIIKSFSKGNNSQ